MQDFNSQNTNAAAHTLSRRQAIGLGARTAASLLLAPQLFGAAGKRRVVVWSEGTAPKSVYPKDVNGRNSRFRGIE